jgi:toxin CcdB
MQLEVFPNPLAKARRAYPYVVVLQSDVAALGQERLIAFLAPLEGVGAVGGRLMPVVEIDKRSFVVLMPSITNVPVTRLRNAVGDLHAFRDSIVDAIGWTFVGG